MDFEAIEQGGRHMIDRLSDAKEPVLADMRLQHADFQAWNQHDVLSTVLAFNFKFYPHDTP